MLSSTYYEKKKKIKLESFKFNSPVLFYASFKKGFLLYSGKESK